MNAAFLILSLLAVAGALLAIRLRNLVHATLSLMLFFVALAGLFVLLMAEFIAAVQILVYVGAVGILILFAIMLTPHVTGENLERLCSRGWIWGLAGAGAVFFILSAPVLLMAGPDFRPATAAIPPSVRDIGLALMNPYGITLLVMALLLTAALVGAVVAASPAERDKNPTGTKDFKSS